MSAPSSLAALLLAGWTGLGFAAAGLPSLPSLPWAPHLPAWAERWLWNPRERTGRALTAYDKGDARRAQAPADTALRLAPGDPLTAYNDGTVHLGAGDRRRAAALLERAAEGARNARSSDLLGAASYNLGNARLADGDAAGAVEAYRQALRSRPDDADAKFNLELALRRREQESKRMGAPRQGQRGDRSDRGGGREESERSGSDRPGDRQQGRGAADPRPGQQRQQDEGAQGRPGERPPANPRPGQGPLPQFHDQPDMSAAEAAALLQSVENLERQQRRAEALRRAQRRTAKGKDW